MIRTFTRRYRHLVLILTATLSACIEGAPEGDWQAVQAVADAYVEAWLANDSSSVLAALSEDAVLLPQGQAPVRGKEAIAEFWWPAGGPPTTITRYVSTVEQMDVSGTLASIWGTAELGFAWEADGELQEATNRSAYLMVLRPDASGAWRISHRMWGRLPE
jgi:uncharacterized protein (TIGR02246 family)